MSSAIHSSPAADAEDANASRPPRDLTGVCGSADRGTRQLRAAGAADARAHRDDPTHAQRFPCRARRGCPRGGSRGRQAHRGRRATAPAWSADSDQGRRGPCRAPDLLRLLGTVRGQGRGLRDGAPPARGRRGDRRQDQHARDRPLPVHRGQSLRRHTQSLEPRSHPRRLQWRLGRGGRRAHRPSRSWLRRSRLGAHSGRLVQPRRRQAPARTHLHLA